jgi:D-alanine--poly(phosphoribitol) ligase subunit 1
VSDFADEIERAFALHSEAAALCIDGVRHSYHELRRRVLAFQRLLDPRRDELGSLIGVWADDSLDSYAAVLAILRSGRGFVPLNPQHPAARNSGILGQAGVTTILVSDDALASASDITSQARFLTAHSGAALCEVPFVRAAPEAIAYLLFTSGSTGEPKGVPITRANLSAFLEALKVSGFAAEAGDRVLQMFDLTFDFSIASYLAPLAAGACVYPVPRSSAKFAEIYRLLSDHRLTVAPLVPSVLTYLRPYFADIQLPDLRQTVLCGEALYAGLGSEWMKCAPAARIANFYGPTEATVFAMLYEWQPADGHAKAFNGVVSIGRPMQRNRALVVDAALQPVAADEKGELCLAGPQLTPGYWRDATRNNDSFFEHTAGSERHRYYRTGDVVTRDIDGDHYFMGRMGNQIKVQGYRVELAEIEFHARELLHGYQCVVLASGAGNAQLSLIVESYSGDLEKLLRLLRARLPPYMVPTRALSVPRLPMNANGKIDRVALQHDLKSL